jgi:hypothetical protein
MASFAPAAIPVFLRFGGCEEVEAGRLTPDVTFGTAEGDGLTVTASVQIMPPLADLLRAMANDLAAV